MAGIVAGVATVAVVSLTGAKPAHVAVAAGAGAGPQHRHHRAGREFCRADRG